MGEFSESRLFLAFCGRKYLAKKDGSCEEEEFHLGRASSGLI